VPPVKGGVDAPRKPHARFDGTAADFGLDESHERRHPYCNQGTTGHLLVPDRIAISDLAALNRRQRDRRHGRLAPVLQNIAGSPEVDSLNRFGGPVLLPADGNPVFGAMDLMPQPMGVTALPVAVSRVVDPPLRPQ
jgi:hypothetical protein